MASATDTLAAARPSKRGTLTERAGKSLGSQTKNLGSQTKDQAKAIKGKLAGKLGRKQKADDAVDESTA